MTQSLRICGLCAALLLVLQTGVKGEGPRETPLVRAIKRVSPSVVNIHTEKTAPDRDSVFTAGGKARKINGMGTGVVFDDRGYIVTNFHVINEVELIRVTFDDGADFEARTVSFDRDQDLAIIKVEGSKPFRVCPSGTSSDLMLGETVVAVGNAFGYRDTITSGIVSALGRDVEVNEKQSYRNLIQTDASINPGNSGGPLINLDGEVIGINVAIRAGAQRIGFAIPIDDARKTVARLISSEQLAYVHHGVLLKDDKSGSRRQLLVDGVTAEGPGSVAGLQRGDVVTKVAGRDVVDATDFERSLIGHRAGEKIDVIVRRGEKSEPLSLQLATLPNGRSSLAMEVVAPRGATADRHSDQYWRLWGVRLATLPETQKQVVGPRYRGGMRVMDVRLDSPAAQNGITKGDILVGLQDWETIKQEDLSWIVNRSQELRLQTLKFYIVRGQETLFGHLQTASR